MTMGDEANSSGSDSEPSADNLDEEEMAKIAPIKITKKPEPKKKEEKKPAPTTSKSNRPSLKKPPSPVGKRPVVKEISRSPTKRPFGYNPFDRLSLRKRKPEMKDAWT